MAIWDEIRVSRRRNEAGPSTLPMRGTDGIDAG
jgi:hypothetical protein